MIKVSVIVPIYNVEKYLRRSIESIRQQSLNNIQIILVNDGSTDGSLKICKEYQEKDSRIEIIDKPNGGVSSARNAGIEIAKGNYIGFVDSDDWIEPEMYKNMYNLVRDTEADVCICDYILESRNKSTHKILEVEKNLLKKQETIRTIIADMLGDSSLDSGSETVMGSVCRLLIKKELISYNDLKFDIGLSFMEDLIFCVRLLLKSTLVCIDRGLHYHYMTNPNSAVTSYKENLISLQQKVNYTLESLLKEEKLYLIVEQRMNTRYVTMILSTITNEIHKDNYKKEKEKIEFINSLCRDEKLVRILEDIDTKGYTIRKKIVLFALKNKMGTFLYCYYSFLHRIIKKVSY